MYPLSAVLVNCAETRPIDISTLLVENGLTIAEEFPSWEELSKKWQTPPADRHIIVNRIQGLGQVAGMEKVSDSFPGWPIVALVDGNPDSEGLYRVSRAGACQLLPFPVDPSDLEQALARVVAQLGLQSAPARVIGVSGAAPGSGATVLAVNLAAEISQTFHISCILTELEFGVGRLAGYLNITPLNSTRDLLAPTAVPSTATLLSSLSSIRTNLRILSGPCRTVDPFQPPPGRVTQLITLLRRATPITIVDLPGTFDQTFFEALAAIDRLILVGRQDVPTIQAMRMVREGILGRSLPDPWLVLSSFNPEQELFSPGKVAEILRSKPPKTIAIDPKVVRESLDEGKPLVEFAPDCPSRQDICQLANSLLQDLGYAVTLPEPRKKRFWQKLFG